MSRRRAAEKRTILPDHKYKDLVLAKFMNRIMLDGKKSTSEKIVYATKRNEKTMKERVANEIIDAFNNKGNAVKKREETHKMADANRAFSHFRW